MIRDVNLVQLTGRLGADPEMRYTAQGSAITTFRVASNRTRRTPDGAILEDTEWFRVVAWARLAEICNTYLGKASRVYIEGRLRSYTWTDEQGKSRTTVEVVASEVILLDRPSSRTEGSNLPSTVAVAPPAVASALPEPLVEPDPPVVAPAPPAAPAARPASAGARVRGRGLRQRLADIVESAPPVEAERTRVVIEERDLPI